MLKSNLQNVRVGCAHVVYSSGRAVQSSMRSFGNVFKVSDICCNQDEVVGDGGSGDALIVYTASNIFRYLLKLSVFSLTVGEFLESITPRPAAARVLTFSLFLRSYFPCRPKSFAAARKRSRV